MREGLSDREYHVLESIIRTFILTASPVGSRYLSKQSGIGLSDATFRNVMSDLEEKGYIAQPHTSAGRIPTDKGYRFYVNAMMSIGVPLKSEKKSIDAKIKSVEKVSTKDTILKESTRILGKISKQISIILTPKLSKGVFHRLDLIPVSSDKLMIVISVEDGLIKTMVIESRTMIPEKEISKLSSLLNERLSGLSLKEIKKSFSQRISDYQGDKELVRVFLESYNKIFEDSPEERVIISGRENVFSKPEFEDLIKVRGIIELVENKNVILHLVENSNLESNLNSAVRISIGKENQESKMKDCSLITARYYVGESEGLLGVIGPTRMDYAKMARIINYMACKLTKKFS